ncbi:MAG: MBOAT family O-acyltransferase [Schleiferiaceae bacterium]
MVFSSLLFLLYFLPVFLALYYWTPNRFKNAWVLIGSILFYSWGAPKFIAVILLSTFIDFHFVRWMDASQSKRKRQLWLLGSLTINLGLLAYFKYSNFFIENVNALLSPLGGEPIHWVKLVLPLGISFYTFETVTYVVDVYRKEHKPLNNFWDYQLYIIYFPKLIAGPIVRFIDFADQISDRFKGDSWDQRLRGFQRFCIGLGKKVLIANSVGSYADEIMAVAPEELTPSIAWIGILCYTFQIYFDFSGYSDMALGLGRMMGFRLPENFEDPYTSASITEFWRRWHITLGAWMKNYLYIPLGGNQSSPKWKVYRNLWIVFLFSGLWHGASWNFVLWGAYHGAFLILERWFLLKWYQKLGSILPRIITFTAVVFGWIFFRIETFDGAIEYVKALFVSDGHYVFIKGSHLYFYLGIAALFSFFVLIPGGQRLQNWLYKAEGKFSALSFALSLALLWVSVMSLAQNSFNPFIYFRF